MQIAESLREAPGQIRNAIHLSRAILDGAIVASEERLDGGVDGEGRGGRWPRDECLHDSLSRDRIEGEDVFPVIPVMGERARLARETVRSSGQRERLAGIHRNGPMLDSGGRARESIILINAG